VDDGPDAVENSSKPVHDPVDSPVNKLRTFLKELL